MNKLILLLIICAITENISSQVGINTQDPKATLDVKAITNDASVIDGFIAPRLSGSQLQSKNSLYGLDQIGASVYVESASPSAGVNGDKTINVTSAGYYYFDGTLWQPIVAKVSNGLTKDNDGIKLGGTITQPTTISTITSTNKLAFTAIGVDAINFDNNTLSIDAANNRIGVGTAAPVRSFDVEGTMRLSQSVSANTPALLSSMSRPVYINQNTGQVEYAPDGFTSVSGGFRPGSSYLLKTFPRFSTIVRIRFVCHVNKSNEENNSLSQAYTYGDITMIGMGYANPIKIINTDIRAYDGSPKSLITNNATSISWSNYSQGITTLSLDQSTGEFRIRTVDENTGTNISTMSYLFEFLGGV